MNWYVGSMEIFFPKLKEICVDRRDEDIFKAIERSEHKKIVVLVN